MSKSSLTAKQTSSKSDEWRTPGSLFDVLHREFRFTLDAAARRTNRKVREYFGPDHVQAKRRDALRVDWVNRDGSPATVFCNPPFSRLAEVVSWAVKQKQAVYATSVLVLPNKTETEWYHDPLLASVVDEIRQIRRRVTYETAKGGDAPALFPSIVMVIRGRTPVFTHAVPRFVWWDLQPALTSRRLAQRRRVETGISWRRRR